MAALSWSGDLLDLEGVEAKEPSWEPDIVLPRAPEPVDPAARVLAGACFDDKRRALRRATLVSSLGFTLFVVAALTLAREVGAEPVPPPEGPPSQGGASPPPRSW